ncbi:MAG: tRNA (adenosine(37)-N6)-dimethylallyltransferase MiaA [Methyloversatilis discipulorum]|uniref:tRNA (adenosine(37)-N6)-dimethylallyltransferase MiaA n=1 Tax=Methyloversatilis discipulorum TaxID=1119528 RepID=UPI0026F251FF|nr:tRNA (adenosine(37)-N6)-dimethylallyltransferase MiaA [Methyloversatilis discipulorum]MBV5286178.1 tRNA (adenosine(37)-N6)-dimethylallyltransferase MiaA [Methyloversatilis discipulorum]
MAASSASAPPVLVLLGPTASGKTAAVARIARALPIELISVDSALVFRDMDIGTAKPSAEEQALCPHHLIDIVSPEEAYSAARFATDARSLIADIRARGRIPLLAGGSMLYIKALREGLSDLPEADAALRADIDARAAEQGWPALHAELARLDADAAARLKPTDAQRIQRALEIVLLTGRPLAESYARRENDAPLPPMTVLSLEPSDRAWLHRRIEQRFDQMLEQGLVDELRRLRTKYRLDAGMPSMRCVGYRQVWSFLEGEVDASTMRDTGIYATRQLAKRQITWLRSMQIDQRIDCLRDDAADAVMDAFARSVRTPQA